MQIVTVPAEFQPKMKKPYPAHQVGPRMEEYAAGWMADHPNALTDEYVYVPIFWDNYHVLHGFGKDRTALQEFCNGLDVKYRGKKMFTVVEYADGILVKANIQTFACGGNGDVPIPLLSDPHPHNHQTNPKYYATFVGSLKTHVCRERMAQHTLPGWYISKSQSTDQFRFLMDNSKYALCPRGYGPTSYRLFEAIQMGCVPVYIGDKFWLPYSDKLDWSEFAVLVPCSHVDRLPQILAKEDAKYGARVEALHKVQPMFTHDEAMRYVVERAV